MYECCGAFQVALVVKNSPATAGDMGSIPSSGRSPGWIGNGNPFQYSCWENPMDIGAWQAQFSSVQSLSCVRFFADPWTASRQASLSITNSRSLLKLMFTESVMPSNHLILCCPLLLLASIFPSIRVFSSESGLHIRWTKYWSFSSSISPSSEYSGLISRTAWAGEVLWEPLLPGKDLGKNGYGRWLGWFQAYTECWWVKDSTVRRLADYKAESQNAFLADMSSGPPVLFSRVSSSLPFFLSVKKFQTNLRVALWKVRWVSYFIYFHNRKVMQVCSLEQITHLLNQERTILLTNCSLLVLRSRAKIVLA